ncbi:MULTISPECIES: hypothetical protein [Streptomycetaceae]|uniref:Uncharacterized protein n=1 Tax=Streptantibioticus cattleyicolor (strain ATCC 35852 / DSM 46488 / JCM 4925 / NBRC 14057 / NRRL 8057) TaxID=1003195 RepID=F8JTF0_STREN|nr:MULTISPECIES: hypothetical protein [Streptomycetaceae]AEW95509.1 hypothetical protein SCATT_31380 [Streptantibioticus cattleyicolor NRRL 8057 = DSM 46488]MYS60069.1 hypothetical protein [Streptomyces sp. SID5468]CCB75848.1 conserved protein of unknown function [Streptantibioticus cattleyicolor NRRL 8057 = DSM 46488]
MAQTFRQFRQRHVLTLNTDGRPHPVENTLTVITVVLGAVAALTSLSRGLHLVSSWTGLLGIVSGAYGQYISATTAERFLLVIGLGAAAVGFFIGMAHGGLFGGVV